MLDVTRFLATFCCGVFFGAALYISLVQHPAALETGKEFAVRFFRPMYRRATVLQATLAIVACVSGMVSWVGGAGSFVVRLCHSHRHDRAVHVNCDQTRQRCFTSDRR